MISIADRIRLIAAGRGHPVEAVVDRVFKDNRGALGAMTDGQLVSAVGDALGLLDEIKAAAADGRDISDDVAGLDWWNAMGDLDRTYWLAVAGRGRPANEAVSPAEAWAAYKLADAATLAIFNA